MHDGLVMDGIEPVFVVGVPRSGTTLVQLLIAAHPAFSSGPETHFFSYVLEPIDGWRERRLEQQDLATVFGRLSEKPGIELGQEAKESLGALAGDDGVPVSVLLHELMTHVAARSTVPSGLRWVEKTPKHALFVPEILGLFPQARVVHVLRDPKDTTSSFPSFQELESLTDRWEMCIGRAELWNTIVAAMRGLTSDDRVRTVRYEDIIENPLQAVEGIMAFLGTEQRTESLDSFSQHYDDVVTSSEDEHKSLCAVGEIVDRRGIWRTRMSRAEARLVEILCEDLMVPSGYVPDLISGVSPRRKRAILWLERNRIGLCNRLRRLGRGCLHAARRLLSPAYRVLMRLLGRAS